MASNLSSMERDKLNKWKRWAEAIHGEVRELHIRHYVWSELVDIIDGNPEPKQPSVFYEWLPVVYTHTQMCGSSQDG